MTNLRRAMDRESERFDLAPGALDRFFDRQQRKDRNKRIRAGLVAAATLAVVAWLVTPLFGGLSSHPRPTSSLASSPDDQQPYSDIAGSYSVTLSRADLGVSVEGMAGTYTMRLFPDGAVLISAPVGALQEGPSPSGITYRLSGTRFTINAFVNISCPGTVGNYQWKLAGGRLVFTPLQDVCAVRRTLFASKPWLVQEPGTFP
jgi:hypothetical protein